MMFRDLMKRLDERAKKSDHVGDATKYEDGLGEVGLFAECASRQGVVSDARSGEGGAGSSGGRAGP